VSFSRDATGRLRAPWRIVSFVLLFFAAALPVEFARLGLVRLTETPPEILELAKPVGLVLAALFATHIMLRYVEHRSWSLVLLDRSALEPRGLALGTITGLLPIGVPCALLYASGWMSRQPAPSGSWITAAIGVTLFLLPAAFVEELLVRGYPFAVVREGAGVGAALVSTGVVFGVLHAMNPGASIQSIAIVALAGIYLGVVLVATNSLVAVTLAHAAWNWVMAVLLHTPVSGHALPAPNYRIVDSGPDWATGGSWGPEAGVPAALAMVLMIPLLMKFRPDGARQLFGTRPMAATNGGLPGDSNG